LAENFAALIEASADGSPRRPALAWHGGTLTYEEVNRRASCAAGALAARGIRAGDRVAISLPNTWSFVVALLGALKLGAIAAPLNPLLTAEERATILADLAPALVVSEADCAGSPAQSRRAVSSPALILYTSGSTGRPKGALLSHDALSFANQSWAGPVMRLSSRDVVLGVLPFAHSFGINGALFAPLLAGATVVLLERFSPDAALEAIEQHQVTVFPGVATMFRRLLDAPGFARQRLASLRLAVSGAAPCPGELAQEWRERTGVRILRGYGSTEIFRPISYLAGDPAESLEAIGRAVPGVILRIVNEAEQTQPSGQAGELLIKSPAVMDGYLGAPEETPVVLHDGWFRTGDLARIDLDGFVTIVGRKKELILRGGYSVSPAEVEAALLTHPAVAEAAVVGRPHPELGEDIAAFVMLHPHTHADPDELIAHCGKSLAAFKCPRRVRVVDALPRSATGKILKSRLADL
jgi:long-chain acyl-CoA synthetase